MNLEQLYDSVADGYDKEYQQAQYARDEQQTAKLLQKLKPYGRVLSLGCGTGQDIDIGNFVKQYFVGLDNSINMLSKAMVKYPGYTFAKWDCSTPYPNMSDTVVSLFGTINYVGINSFTDQIQQSCAFKWFGVMFSPQYKPGLGSEHCTYYHPVEIREAFAKIGREVHIRALFGGSLLAEDYWVISSDEV